MTQINADSVEPNFKSRGNSQVFVIFVNIMQLQYMWMLNQFQNSNLPLNLVGEERQTGRKRSKDTTEEQHSCYSNCPNVNELREGLNIEYGAEDIWIYVKLELV